ncbi:MULTISPECIES: methyl-accepting chemotaxis protein [unclassified Desulfovibrio]|uniref:methyl-accepting chemotaxis protein n=1 Tax=unclassified Desulfovibrio TaxID=2593640 RepID=UPI00163B5496|nr:MULTISPECIES: methyl-accepting chemotaxis protein [unclassified Desulfovibrio]
MPEWVGLDISLETLTKEIGSVTVGRTGYVFMMDATGLIICDPKNSGDNVAVAQRWLGKTVAPKPGVAEPLPVPGDALAALSSLRDKKQGVDEVGIGGKTWMAGVRTTQNGWTLVMLQEKDEIFADAMQVTLGILLVGLVIAVVMTIVAWLVARSIAGPITRLAGASQQVAEGDLQAIPEGDLQAIPEDGKAFRGELGILHKSLKLMVGKLVELIETANAKIREAEEALELSRSSLAQAEEAKRQAENARREGVLQTAGQIGAVIDQLAASAARLAEEALCTEQRAAEQTERVRGTIVAMEQMNAAVSNVAHSTSRTASLADESRTEAMSGRQLVMQVVSSMSEIEKQSLSMREGLEHLGGQASDIGKIMNVITDIADQTNLLALNAAIEAARAGEAGRGFAVVADEVRKLAEKTMEATRQVGEAISIIQSGTTTNINAMQEAASYIGKAAEVANNAGEALASIEQMVQNTAGEVRSIAIASEEQSATIEAINRSTEDIRRITDEVAAGAQRSNHAASELTQLSDRLYSVVQELRKG